MRLIGLIASVLLLQAQTALEALAQGETNNEFPPSEVAINMVFSGLRPEFNLALTYKFLIEHHPETIVSEEANPLPFFWMAAVKEGAWPSGADQPAYLADAFRDRRQPVIAYRIPKLHPQSIEVFQAVPLLGLSSNETSLSESARRALCDNLVGDRLQTAGNGKCFVQLLPSESDSWLHGSDSRRMAIIRSVAYGLTLDGRFSLEEASSIKHELIKTIRIFGDGDNLPYITISPTSASKLSNGDPLNFCDLAEQDYAVATKTLRAVAHWPEDSTTMPSPQTESILVVADPDLTTYSPFANLNDPRALDATWPQALRTRLQHPWLFAIPPQLFQPTCPDVPSLSGGGLGEHAAAVASVVFGQATDVSFDSTKLGLSGLLAPSNEGQLLFAGEGVFGTSIVTQGGHYVLVAPFQSQPRTTSVSQERKRLLAYTWTMFPILIAAPIAKQNSAPFRAFNPASFTQLLTGSQLCSEFPACLGSTSMALVVAAVNEKRELMEREPGSGLPYNLGSEVVGVAAPGRLLVTASTDSDLKAGLAYRSGTSVALSSVAALAMRLMDSGVFNASTGVLNRIAATSDLSILSGDKVRFGIINAKRALAGIGLPKQAAIVPISANEGEDVANTPSQFASIRGYTYGFANGGRVCPQSRNYDKAGWLPYYLTTDDYSAPGKEVPCIPVDLLLRIRKTGKDADSNPLFTIIFLSWAATQEIDGVTFTAPQPNIVRNVRLSPLNTISVCRFSGGDVRAKGNTRPCLRRINGDNSEQAIDLDKFDITFGPKEF
jgi:hypothetical protein